MSTKLSLAQVEEILSDACYNDQFETHDLKKAIRILSLLDLLNPERIEAPKKQAAKKAPKKPTE